MRSWRRIPESLWRQITADCERDYFMSAEEAMAYGLIDKVIYKR